MKLSPDLGLFRNTVFSFYSLALLPRLQKRKGKYEKEKKISEAKGNFFLKFLMDSALQSFF